MTPAEKIPLLYEAFSSKFPSPKSELRYDSPFQLLVATIMAAQSTDKKVNEINETLFSICPDATSMAATDPETIRDTIKSINYYNNKAKNIHAVSKILLEKHGGDVPETREELEKLPGVGRKTANVVLANAFGQPVMAVDTHVQRVSNRIGLCTTTTPRETEDALIAIIPPGQVADFHHYLLLHGRYTCKARKPDCENCPITSVCDTYKSNE